MGSKRGRQARPQGFLYLLASLDQHLREACHLIIKFPSAHCSVQRNCNFMPSVSPRKCAWGPWGGGGGGEGPWGREGKIEGGNQLIFAPANIIYTPYCTNQRVGVVLVNDSPPHQDSKFNFFLLVAATNIGHRLNLCFLGCYTQRIPTVATLVKCFWFILSLLVLGDRFH